jgi:hypothetical protein
MTHLDAYLLPGMPGAVCLRMRLDAARLADLDAADDRTTWVHLAYEGAWAGHPDGAFEFTGATFSTIVANFERQANPITLTYEHPHPKLYAQGQAIPAAGRVVELEIRDHEVDAPNIEGVVANLWGLIRFTEAAAEHVKAEEYLYTSVVVFFAATDRETDEELGPMLGQVGLVNEPFLDGQVAIQLSAVPGSGRRAASKAPKPDAPKPFGGLFAVITPEQISALAPKKR